MKNINGSHVTRLVAGFVLFVILSLATGCSVISSRSRSIVEGTQVGTETLAMINVGETTKSWLVSALGMPDEADSIENGKIPLYSSKRITKRSGHLLFVIDSSSEKVEKETYYFEFREGLLRRYWREET